MTLVDADDAELEKRVMLAAAGDESAWQALWQSLEPRLHGILRETPSLGPLRQRDDDLRSIVVEVMARLCAARFRRLHVYLATRRDHPNVRFVPWLIVVARRVAIDYLRAHPDYVDRRRQADPSTPGAWMAPGTLPSETRLGADRPAFTRRGTAREILRYAGAEIPPAQRRALELWLESATNDEIAGQLGLAGAGDAERLVRAALERLRRYFRAHEGET